MFKTFYILLILTFVMSFSRCGKVSQKTFFGERLILGGTEYKVDSIYIHETIEFFDPNFGPRTFRPPDSSMVFYDVVLSIRNLKHGFAFIEKLPIAFIDGEGKECLEMNGLQYHNSIVDSANVSYQFICKRTAVPGSTIRVKDLFSDQNGMLYLAKR